jgi:hypothetical protein
MAVTLQSVKSLNNRKFLLELRAAARAPVVAPTLVAIVDESGSMSGAPFKSCVDGLTRLLEVQSPLTVILFSSHARSVVVRTPADVHAIQPAYGGTCFGPAITQLKGLLPTFNDLVEVIMFTDGQASDSSFPADSALNTRCRFHVIGLGSFSDTAALLEIRRLGYERGTFGFAQSPAELSAKIAEAAEFSGTGTIARYRGQQLFLRNDQPAFLVVDSLDASTGETQVDVQPSTFEDEMLCFRLRLQSLAEVPTDAAVTALREEFNAVVESKTSAAFTREEYGAVIEVATALNDIAFILRQHRGSALPNAALALINERASQVVTRRFAKLADKRADAAVARLAAQDKRIVELQAEFATLVPEDEPPLQCALSRMSVAELLASGDCLCVGVRGAGKDVVIANPWLFRVEEVTPTLLSFCSFTDAAYYTLKQNRSAIREFSETKIPDALTKGVAAESISGVIPLFVSERHWRMASLYLDRATAMLLCKDPTLGTYQHRLAAVFLLLRWIGRQPGSEFMSFLNTELLRTLHGVWDRRPGDFPTPETFLASVEKRLPPSLPDLRCAEGLWQTLELPLEPATEFVIAMSEERWRRDPKGRPVVQLTDCGDFAPLVTPFGSDDDPVPTFQGKPEDFEPRLPTVAFGFDIPVNESLAWRLLGIVLQLQASESVGTMEWPTVRQEFTAESAHAYVKQQAVAYIETRRKDVVAKWASDAHNRLRMRRRAYIARTPECDVKQEDFDFTSYLGRGDRHSKLSEVGEVFLHWVRSPRELAFAARMRRLDKDADTFYVPSKRVQALIRQTHSWATPELLASIWPK